jgi:hypothetical protein
MHSSQFPPFPQSASSATATSDPAFVETVEYHRFVEFCDACREFRYIGLCYGAPGIGKTLSALRYSRAEMILKVHREPAESRDQLPIDTVLYTTEVVNTPARVQSDIRTTRERLKDVALRPIHREANRHTRSHSTAGQGPPRRDNEQAGLLTLRSTSGRSFLLRNF